ncbi:hypothetical protein [Oceaniradius stylonematis]|jgi:hypothetical protein
MLNRLAMSVLISGTIAGATVPAHADQARDARFFQKIEGQWRGPGEIVAGKYRGTKFICQFDGSVPDSRLGMSLDGDCRVGLFTQKMTATVQRDGRTYSGTFLDGAGGEGLDVTAGNVSRDRVALTLNRKQLDGAMLARLADDNTLNVTVSVRVGGELVPVIGMSLDRLDPVQVGSVR